MLEEILGERQHPARGFALRRPFHNFAVVLETINVAEPHVLFRRGDQDNVRNITGAQTAADGELDVLEKTPPAPLRFEPLYGDRRLAPLGLSAATADANGNLADHEALGGYGMAHRVRRS